MSAERASNSRSIARTSSLELATSQARARAVASAFFASAFLAAIMPYSPDSGPARAAKL